MSFVCPSFRGLIQELRTGFSAAISNAATNINQPMAILYLGHMSNVSTMGIFGAATTIIAAAKQILIPLSQLAYSHTSFIESRDQGKAIKAKTMSVLWVAIAGAIISIFLLIGAGAYHGSFLWQTIFSSSQFNQNNVNDPVFVFTVADGKYPVPFLYRERIPGCFGYVY